MRQQSSVQISVGKMGMDRSYSSAYHVRPSSQVDYKQPTGTDSVNQLKGESSKGQTNKEHSSEERVNMVGEYGNVNDHLQGKSQVDEGEEIVVSGSFGRKK